MEAVKSFNEELSGIYETKPPISRAKMTLLTKKAIKGIKYYKHIVQSMEKFVQKCRPEYKVPGLYVIDSVVRQSRHQFGPEKDVFMPRLCKNIITTFQHIYKCPPDDKTRVLRVLNLWQKNSVFPPDVVQRLTEMSGASADAGQSSAASALLSKEQSASKMAQPDQANLTNLLTNLLSNPDANQIQNLAGLLSSSQQNQLEDLLKQVKGADQLCFDSEEERYMYPYQPTNHKEPSPPPQVNIMPSNNSYQGPPKANHPPSFYQAQLSDMESNKPSFNREVLDFDYGDDDQTPPAKIAKQSHSIDPSLLAKLPTADQIQQLTGSRANSGMGAMDPSNDQRQRLEQEQAIFNKQIEELEEQSQQVDKNNRSGHGENRRRKRSRSRSQSRDSRHHRHHRKRSHSRDRHRSRRSRSREHSRRSRRSRSRSHDHRRDKKGFPPVKEGFVSVCTTTLWIGNISSKVMQHELQAMVEEYGKVDSINMIPPRGCAYVCMKDRREADRALHKIKYCRLGGKSLKCDWAPSKEMPEEQKETWVKDLGVNYVELSSDPSFLPGLTNWGCVDLDSVPEHRKAELNPPEPEEEVASETVVPPSQPQLVQSFSPAVASAPGIINRPQVPVMVRPFQLNPFRMQQQMNLAPRPSMPERPPMGAAAPVPVPAPASDGTIDMKLDSPGATTPTADEKPDDPAAHPVQVQAQPMAQFRPQFGPVSVAQRFGGHVPVQLQMMPNMGQQVMPARMGMMPMRIGVPMQIRPGFHPGMQRLPMHGHPQVMQNHHLQPGLPQRQPMMRQQPGGFPPNMQMGVPRQLPVGMAQRPERPPVVGRPPGPPPIDRQTSNQSNNNQEHEGQEFQSSPPSRGPRGFHDGPPQERPRIPLNRPPMPRPGEFRPQFETNRPRLLRPAYMVRPPMGMIRPPIRMGRINAPPDPSLDLGGPQEADKSAMDVDRPPMDVDRPPRGVDGPQRDMDRPPRDMDRPPRDMDRPPRDMDRPPRDTDRPSRDMDRPPRDTDRPSRDVDRPPRDTDRPSRDVDRPPRDTDRSSRDVDRPPRDTDRPSRDVDRPPRDTDRPSRDIDRPSRDRPPRDMDRPSRDSERSRDVDRSSRERRDHDRGRRDRSRDRDRRDRDMDRDRRGRDRDMDRDRRDRDRGGNRDRRGRNFDRGGRDFDRRDRGSSRGGRGGFRGRDDRGRGRGGRGRGGGGGFGRGGFGRGRGDRRSPEVDPEEEEYQRKRQETLRKRHEEDEDYVVEEIDFSAFGLPSGFGGSMTIGDSSKAEDKPERSPGRREQRRGSNDRKSRRKSPEKKNDNKDPPVSTKKEKNPSPDSGSDVKTIDQPPESDNACCDVKTFDQPSESDNTVCDVKSFDQSPESDNAGCDVKIFDQPPESDNAGCDVKIFDQPPESDNAGYDVKIFDQPPESDNAGCDVTDSTPFMDPPEEDRNKLSPVDADVENINTDTDQVPETLDLEPADTGHSPGTPTIDEQGNHVVEEEEILLQETDSKNQVAPEQTD